MQDRIKQKGISTSNKEGNVCTKALWRRETKLFKPAKLFVRGHIGDPWRPWTENSGTITRPQTWPDWHVEEKPFYLSGDSFLSSLLWKYIVDYLQFEHHFRVWIFRWDTRWVEVRRWEDVNEELRSMYPSWTPNISKSLWNINTSISLLLQC